MTIQLAAEDQELIDEMIENGPYTDSSEVIHEALRALDERLKLERLRALLDEGAASYARGEVHELTPELVEAIWERSKANAKAGAPVPSHVRP